jgi:hypothetical protein
LTKSAFKALINSPTSLDLKESLTLQQTQEHYNGLTNVNIIQLRHWDGTRLPCPKILQTITIATITVTKVVVEPVITTTTDFKVTTINIT